jgi:asparagine N-glycosylation enzyme membrane subunit Stt3
MRLNLLSGYIAPWSGRFYSLFDTGYAKIHIPIIASVSEHQPTTWLSFFFDLHITAAVFPAGLWFCIQNVNDLRIFGESLSLSYLLTVSLSDPLCRHRSLFRRSHGLIYLQEL